MDIEFYPEDELDFKKTALASEQVYWAVYYEDKSCEYGIRKVRKEWGSPVKNQLITQNSRGERIDKSNNISKMRAFASLDFLKENGTKKEQQHWDISNKDEKMKKNESINNEIPLNQILYGPPGTGKTYSTLGKALEILEANDEQKENITSIGKLKEEFGSQVEFITFHQSFSYEDFVEGLKAEADDGKLTYNIRGGIFKEICENASSKTKISTKSTINSNAVIWKMSLGNSQTDESKEYFEEAIKTDSLVLGWGNCQDFSQCITKKDIENKFTPERKSEYPIEASFVHSFKNKMTKGDIVIISDGNKKFKAIVEITGDYYFDKDSDLQEKRKIKWLQIFSNSLPISDISKKSFTQSTINQPQHIDKEKLQKLLSPIEKNENYVLIIDEINRGNISRIFGELITLIEESKRGGNTEEISLQLPYSKKSFTVPSNLYIIGTMNTADRSLTLMDTALRRRFDFIEIMPNPCLLHLKDFEPKHFDSMQEWEISWNYDKKEDDEYFHKDYEGEDILIEDKVNLRRLLFSINKRIKILYDREHTIGHAFLMHVDNLEKLRNSFKNKILPLLEEYFYDDWEKIKLVLNDKDNSFYDKSEEELEGFSNIIYEKRDVSLLKAEDFQNIYGE